MSLFPLTETSIHFRDIQSERERERERERDIERQTETRVDLKVQIRPLAVGPKNTLQNVALVNIDLTIQEPLLLDRVPVNYSFRIYFQEQTYDGQMDEQTD